MELRQIMRIILRRWWLVLIPVLIAGGLTLPDLLSLPVGGASYTTTLHYSAAHQHEAADLPPRDGDFQDIWLASELTVNALTAWVTTESFRREMAQITAADSIDVLNGPLGVAADHARSLGQITLSWPDPAELEIIAAAAIEALRTRSADYFPQLGGEPAQVTLLDQPRIQGGAPPLTDRFGPLLRVGLALLAGLGLAFLAHYLDPTLHQREEIEALGLKVIATLPRD